MTTLTPNANRRKPNTSRSKSKTYSARKHDSRAAILSAAQAAFAERGFDGAITRDISKDAGVGHSLLLYHFKSKEILWREAVISLRQEHMKEIEARLDLIESASPSKKLWEFIKAFVYFSAKRPEFYRTMMFEARTKNHRLDWLVKFYLGETHARYCKLIAEAQRDGAIRDGDVVRLRYAIIALATIPVSMPAHYKALTGRNISSGAETIRTLDLIKQLLFVSDPES